MIATMNELQALRAWLGDRAKAMRYAVDAIGGTAPTLVLPDCEERLNRYSRAPEAHAEYGEHLADSSR